MERTLASIDVIRELNPIPGADNIEVAKIKGWNVVVKKGEFNEMKFIVSTLINRLKVIIE